MLPVGGNLEKSLSDSSKIDDAIAAAISAHNDDPTAHLGAGQSLESHKTANIIDHPASSVKLDKGSLSLLTYNNLFLDFASGYKQNNGSAWDFDSDYVKAYLNISGDNKYASLARNAFIDLGGLNNKKSFKLYSFFSIEATPSLADYFLFGLGGFSHSDIPIIGFKITSDKLYCIYYDDVITDDYVYYETSITPDLGLNPFSLSAQYDSTADILSYYCNDDLVYSIDSASTKIGFGADGSIYYSSFVDNSGDWSISVFSPIISVDLTY